MILQIVKYGHPILRAKGARIEKITPEIRKLIDDMFETMHGAAGVGLAAQQGGRALQLTVIDVRGAKDRPAMLTLDGKPADVAGGTPAWGVKPGSRARAGGGNRARRG